MKIAAGLTLAVRLGVAAAAAEPKAVEPRQDPVCAEQAAALQRYRQKRPDLSRFGYALAEGLYWERKNAGERSCVAAADARKAIEAVVLEEVLAGFKQEKCDELRQAIPGLTCEALKKLEPKQLRMLELMLRQLAEPPDAKTVDALATRLEAVKPGAKESKGAGNPMRDLEAFYDAAVKARGPTVGELWRIADGPGNAMTAGDDKASYSGRTWRVKAPPPPGVNALVAAAVADQSPYVDLIGANSDVLIKGLAGKSQEEIGRFRDELLVLSGFADLKIKSRALALLSLLHDETLAPVFLNNLDPRQGEAASVSARALGSIIGQWRTRPDGARVFAEKVPALLSQAFASPAVLENGELVRLAAGRLWDTESLPDSEKARFFEGLKDPASAALLLRVHLKENGQRPAAEHLYDRVKAMTPGGKVSRALAQAQASPRETHNLLQSLADRKRLRAELKIDPELGEAMRAALASMSIRDAFVSFPAIVDGLIPGKDKDWSAFAAEAPRLFELAALKPGIMDDDTLRGSVVARLGRLNEMPAKDREQAMRGFADPSAILRLIGLTQNADNVSDTEGLHSDVAKLLFGQFKKSAQGRPLSAFLGGDAGAVKDCLSIAARLHRYEVLQGELRSDPKLADVLAGMVLRADSPLVTEVEWALVKGIWQAVGPRFADLLIARMISAQPDPAFSQERILGYLKFQEAGLTAAQRKLVDAFIKEGLPSVARAIENRTTSAFYATWGGPAAPLNVAVVMTGQGPHPALFRETLAKQGYRLARSSTLPETYGVGGFMSLPVQEFVFEKPAADKSAKPIRLTLDVVPADSDGWAKSKEQLNKYMRRRYADTDHQVVVFRGHANDYDAGGISRIERAGVFFMDLSCDSLYRTGEAIKNCERCGFLGTTTTGEGWVNNLLVPSVLDMLAKRVEFGELRRRLETGPLKGSAHRFSNNEGSENVWSDALHSLANDKDYPRLPYTIGR